MRRKVWGWLLFVFFILVLRLTQINLASYWGEAGINWFIAIGWWVAGVLSLFGWYRLVLHKSNKTKEANNATR